MMTTYISRDDSSSLYHHGVKGMKWGVRHDKERSINSLNKKIKTTSAKIAKSNSNINRYGTRDPLSRYANDVRITRQKHLKATLANRQAKRDYLVNPTEKNKTNLKNTRSDRFTNILTTAVAGPVLKGSYNRYRASGNNATKSAIKTYGSYALRSVPGSVLSSAMSTGAVIAFSMGLAPLGAVTAASYGGALAVPAIATGSSLIGRRINKNKSKTHATYLTREKQKYGTNRIGLRGV